MADLLTKQSLLALSFVGGLVGTAIISASVSLPKRTSRKARWIFIWLAFDALCHFTLEGSFLYLSIQGRTVNSSKGFFAYLWQDYAKADARWGFSDPTVVSLEILTVLGAGPIAAFCAYLIAKNKSSYHFWVVVLSVAELYGGFMTFAPEWLTGNKYLNGSTFLLMWVYLFFMNMAWVVIPFYLIVDSYGEITKALKQTGARPLDKTMAARKLK